MSDERAPCRVCGRNFNPESLAKHEKICVKTTQKKPRKVFDSGRQRAKGSDIPYGKTMKPAGSYAPPPYSEPRGNDTKFVSKNQNSMAVKGAQGGNKSNWRRQHEEFITAVRAAKAYGMAVKTGGPLPPPAPPSEHPDYVSCPTCGRRFNSTAAARHMPFCAEQSNRVATRKIPNANAMMRANARNYAAPTPGNKPKSTSGGGGRGLMGTTALSSGANDYAYDSYASQAPRSGIPAPQGARRSGGGNGSGGAAGRYAAANRQMSDDADFDSYMPAQGPRGSRLGGGSKIPSGSGARLAPVSGGSGRGGPPGSSAFGNRNQGQQAVYLGSNPNGSTPTRGGRQQPGMNGGYADYESMPIGGGGGGGGSGGRSRPAASSDSGQFCYECGNPYPSKTAKFCVECGLKRIA